MFLWIVKESEMGLPLDIKDKLNLYDQFISRWTKRELQRSGKDGLDYIELLKRAWQISSWEIYKMRILEERITLDKLKHRLISIYSEFEEVTTTLAYSDFLDIGLYTMEVKGMFHERFMEYLLSKEIVQCCKESNYPFPDFLEYELRYDINKLIKNLWANETEEDLIKILDNLWLIYENHLIKSDASSLAIRNHVMYYVGRIPHKNALDKLIIANKTEENEFVKLSIAYGLIMLGIEEMEQKFYNNLNNNGACDDMNRGYHLVYYKDWVPTTEKPPYYDDGTYTWDNTLKALLQHIQSKDTKYATLRRIELFTIKRLIEIRKETTPMTPNNLNDIKNSIERMEDQFNGFKETVRDEYLALESTFNKFLK